MTQLERKILFSGSEIKAASDEAGNSWLSGIGSTFENLMSGTPDSYGDVIIKGAFSKTAAMVAADQARVIMLRFHDQSRPLGLWKDLVEEDYNFNVRGPLSNTDDGREMKQLVDDGVVTMLSIGYSIRPGGAYIHEEASEKHGFLIRVLTDIDLREISPVLWGANPNAEGLALEGRAERWIPPRKRNLKTQSDLDLIHQTLSLQEILSRLH